MSLSPSSSVSVYYSHPYTSEASLGSSGAKEPLGLRQWRMSGLPGQPPGLGSTGWGQVYSDHAVLNMYVCAHMHTHSPVHTLEPGGGWLSAEVETTVLGKGAPGSLTVATLLPRFPSMGLFFLLLSSLQQGRMEQTQACLPGGHRATVLAGTAG